MNTASRWIVGLAAATTIVLSSAASAALLTFSEFAVGTVITDQYAPQGVIFSGVGGGSAPIIANDGAMPDSPVLSPNPPYAGAFEMYFLSSTSEVSFQSGFWDAVGTAQIDVYDWAGNLWLSATNSGTGVQLFSFSNPTGGIRRIVFDSTADPAGGDIDNLQFNVPEPNVALLIGIGLLAGFARSLRRR